MAFPDPPIIFPLPHYPTGKVFDQYVQSQYWIHARAHMSAFGGNRADGARQHAAVDLYSPAGTIVMAIADGVIVDDLRTDYLTWADATPGSKDGVAHLAALAVKHPGLGIVRYCEISPMRAIGVGWRFPVRRGQIIGFVGDQGAKRQGKLLVRRETMLHLEWYSDVESDRVDPSYDGAPPADRLSQKGNTTYDSFPNGRKFDRRRDLIDPTDKVQAAPLVTMPPVSADNATLCAPSLPPSLAQLLNHASHLGGLAGGQCMGDDGKWWLK